MDSSLEIIRDQNGYFHHSNGYPLVVIFDSKHREDKTPDEISWQEPVIGLHTHEPEKDTVLIQPKKAKANTQPLKFVNISRPVVYDRKRKKSFQTHVIQDLPQQKREHESSVSKPSDVGSTSIHNVTLCKKTLQFSSEESASQPTSVPRQPSVLLDPFTTFPVNMEPYMHTLIHQYLSLTSNLAKPSELGCRQDLAAQGWFPLAMTDAALFHAILCGSALYMDLLMGRRESLEKVKHMKEVVHLLSTRLRDPGSELSDSTIVAVAHLAEFEASTSSILGNFANWSLHMDGLHKMVQIRGFAALNENLKSKIWRADITGCIATLSKPRFTAIEIPSLSLPPLLLKQPISALCDGMRNIIELFAFDGGLIGIISELQYLTSALNNATMDLLTVDRIVISIQYHLLLFQSAGYKSSQNAALQEVCCIGALVYLETVYHFSLCLQVGKFPASALTDGVTIQKLKSCLDMADMNTAQTRVLFLWIMFLGGAAVAGTKDRAWFVARLVKIVMELQIYNWKDAKSSLMKFLWAGRVHENSCKDLWDEVLITMTVLFGGDC